MEIKRSLKDSYVFEWFTSLTAKMHCGTNVCMLTKKLSILGTFVWQNNQGMLTLFRNSYAHKICHTVTNLLIVLVT